jgi:exosortase O
MTWLRSSGTRTAMLVIAWLALFRGPLRATVTESTGEAMIVDVLVLVALALLALRRGRWPHMDARLRAGPLALVVVTALAHVANGRTAQIELASGILMVLGGWGLLGLHVPTRRWYQALPLVLVGLCVLPVGASLDLYVGFPLRIATAHVTQGLLAPLLGGELATETIILIDGGSAGVQIDLPCSGVRSLHTGALAWAAATWLERTRIDARWWLAGIVYVVTLVATNFARVFALVLLHHFAPTGVTALLHVPLGLVAFVLACAIGWGLLHLLGPDLSRAEAERPRQAAPVTVLVALLLGLAAIPLHGTGGGTPRVLELSAAWARPIALAPAEQRLFDARGADAVGKWDLELGRARAQLVMVRSRSWRAQHRPDACHRGGGRRIEAERTALLADDFPIRVLDLAGADGKRTGVYWFQSASTITDDYSARVWSALDGEAEPWVMVSLVLGGGLPLSDPDVVTLLHTLRHDADVLVRTPNEES